MTHALRRLLTGQLPLQNVGPALRRAARQACAEADPPRMRAVARAIVAELIRRGELVKVAISGTSSLSEPVYMVRDTARLLDLSVLSETVKPRRGVPGSSREPVVASRQAGTESLGLGVDGLEIDRVLVAMEQAQNLPIGDPHSGERDVILEGILSLLNRFLSRLELFVLLEGERPPGGQRSRVLHLGSDPGPPFWLRARRKGSAVWIPSWLEIPRPIRDSLLQERTDVASAQKAARFTAGVAVPLTDPAAAERHERAAEDEIGLLLVLTDGPWTRQDLVRLSRRLARFVSERWRRQREVDLRIHTDSLTGVYNRAQFDRQFPLELERAKRRSSALTLVLADLDHFKAINDQHGHQAGDSVLQAVARQLQAGLRRIDQVCRIGGEEFALILPSTGAEAAQEVLARLLARLSRFQLDPMASEAPLRVTLSFGAVAYPEGGADGFELYRKADEMLYISKETGRNRCHFWNPSGDPTLLLPEKAEG